MAQPIGKYVTLFKGTPTNQVNMSIANEVDWSSFASSTWQEQEVTLDADHKPRVCHAGLNSSQVETYKAIWSGLGLARRPKEGFSLITDGSVYDVLMTADDRAQATNRTMTAIPIGVKPDDWDENYAVKYYQSSVQPNSGDVRQAVYYPAQATWSASTQYYTSDYANWWYVKSGNNVLRFGVGDIGLTSSGFPSVGVLNNTTDSAAQSPMFWTWLHDDTETIIMNNNVAGDYNFPSYSFTSSGEPGTLFNNGQRWRYLFSAIYDNDWSPGYATDEAKGKWRTNCRNKVKIHNTTCTQFGFVTKSGHRYFGIWVLVPTIADMIGFNKYANNAPGLPTLKKPTPIPPDSPHDNDNDLRIYNFDDPILDTQAPNYLRIEFYGVEIDKIGITIEEKEGTRPPDINPDPTTAAGWTPLRPSLPNQRNLGSLASANQAGFHVWCLARDQFQGLVGSLWSWGTFSESYESQLEQHGSIYNPITNSEGSGSINAVIQDWITKGRVDPLAAVQTCMALPSFIAPQVLGENDFGRVKVAGIKTAQQGYCCGHETYIASFTIDCSNTAVTGSYLDVAPNTSAEIYLPYIGTVGLDPASFIGGSITVTYSCCVVDGTISATVVCTSSMAVQNVTQYGPYLGSASYRIPVAQKDANAFQRELGYVKAVGTAVTGVVGAAFGTSKQIAKTMANTFFNTAGDVEQAVLTPQIVHGGELGSGSAIVCPTGDIQVQLSTPLPKHLDEADLKQYGMTSGKVGAIESNSGFCTYSYAKLEGIPATEAEIEEIKAILYGGVYQ